MVDKRRLIVITGPTGSGKSSLVVELARRIDGEIIGADSRQMFRGLPIGTAAPTPEQLAAAPHHMVGCLDLADYYSAANFETDVLSLLPEIWGRGHEAILCGGSMMYIDAVTRGIDELPTITPEVRQRAMQVYTDRGIEGARELLRSLDPVYYSQVDLNNHKRVVHAIEICWQAGVPYSTLRTGQRRERPFEVLKFAIDMPREELFERINRRVETMVADGFIDEARSVYPLRHLNSLNTVGYKEMFAYFDGKMDLPTAIARMQKNTRVYAKKQLTWLRRDPSVTWVDSWEAVFSYF